MSGIGTLRGSSVKQLLEAGVTKALFGVSTTPQYAGDLVSVYFLNDENIELAHQTQMSGRLGIPEVTVYTRSWGGVSAGRGYRPSRTWDYIREMGHSDIVDNHTYRVT
jgi:hypothetical protein